MNDSLYNQLFNPMYVNPDYYSQIQQRDFEQRKEIANAVHAIHDYFDAVRKISPEYQQAAFQACVVAVFEEMNNM